MEKTEWISVKEKVPPRYKTVLFYCSHGVGVGYWADKWTMEYDPRVGKDIKTLDEYLTIGITHWMPWPAPPSQLNTGTSQNTIP